MSADQLLAMAQLRKMLPAAIGWKFYGPFSFSIPDEIIASTASESDTTFSVSGVIIYNYSGASKAELRILYTGSFEFKPKIYYNRRSAPVKWKHDTENSEFIVYDVPPNEHVNIELFNVTKNFTIDQVLVDGQLITELMNKRALSRAYPASGWMKALLLGAFILCATTTSVVAYKLYDNYQKRQDYELLYGEPDGYSGCKVYIFDNQPGQSSRDALIRKINQIEERLPEILARNKVTFISELYDLDRVVLCEPIKK